MLCLQFRSNFHNYITGVATQLPSECINLGLISPEEMLYNQKNVMVLKYWYTTIKVRVLIVQQNWYTNIV